MRILLIVLILFTFTEKGTAQENTSKYIFPMMPKDDQWKKQRYPEKLKLLQVDSSKLKEMSNFELIGSCYEYPFFINFFAFDSFDEGFKNLCSIYNGYNEILERNKSISDDLISFYDAMGKNEFDSPFERYNENYSTLKIFLFEYILSLDKIVSSLDAKQQENLYQACRKKFFIKEKDINVFKDQASFSDTGLKSCIKIICKLALKKEKIMNQEMSSRVSSFLYQGKSDVQFYKSIINFMDSNN